MAPRRCRSERSRPASRFCQGSGRALQCEPQAGVPKWRNRQTRYVQGVVSSRACEFESHLRHQTTPLLLLAASARPPFADNLPTCVKGHPWSTPEPPSLSTSRTNELSKLISLPFPACASATCRPCAPGRRSRRGCEPRSARWGRREPRPKGFGGHPRRPREGCGMSGYPGSAYRPCQGEGA